MALQVSAGSGTARHRHVAAQIVIALEGKIRIQLLPNQPFVKCDAVLIPPNVTHHIAGPGPLSLMMWFDPATSESRAIRIRSESEVVPLYCIHSALCFKTLKQMSATLQQCSDAERLAIAVIQALLPECKAVKPLDNRISFMLSEMSKLSPFDQPYPLTVLAEKVSLSEGRLRHLFRQELGVPLQQYWIGYRLLAAIRQMKRTDSLTTIAQNAGFSDLSHFSRAFRASFGLPPSFAQKDSRFIQASPFRS